MKQVDFMRRAILPGLLMTQFGIVIGQQVAKAPEQNSLKDRFSLVFETGSDHIGQKSYGYYAADDVIKTRPFNDINPGIGVEYRISEHFHAGAGIYRNSLYHPAVYGLVGIETNGHKLLGAGVEAGVVSGYDIAVAPAALPYLRVGSRDARANVKVDLMPPVPGITPAVLTFQLRVNVAKHTPWLRAAR